MDDLVSVSQVDQQLDRGPVKLLVLTAVMAHPVKIMVLPLISSWGLFRLRFFHCEINCIVNNLIVKCLTNEAGQPLSHRERHAFVESVQGSPSLFQFSHACIEVVSRSALSPRPFI